VELPSLREIVILREQEPDGLAAYEGQAAPFDFRLVEAMVGFL
jgi:hypothetical protein